MKVVFDRVAEILMFFGVFICCPIVAIWGLAPEVFALLPGEIPRWKLAGYMRWLTWFWLLGTFQLVKKGQRELFEIAGSEMWLGLLVSFAMAINILSYHHYDLYAADIALMVPFLYAIAITAGVVSCFHERGAMVAIFAAAALIFPHAFAAFAPDTFPADSYVFELAGGVIIGSALLLVYELRRS